MLAMNITVFGCGYVGLTTAVGLAEMGNQVVGVDRDEEKIQLLAGGGVPFFEPGLRELLQRNVREGRLSFSTDAEHGVRSCQIVMSAVGTPPREDHNADLTAVLEVAKIFGRYAGHGAIFINKSTVPVGTSEKIRETILATSPKPFDFHVVSNPEFLREGSALHDFFQPDRLIVGTENGDSSLQKTLLALFRPMTENGVPILFTDIRSAEVIKYASNAYLATRISFINELANFCEVAGADIKTVAKGVGMDKRIGTGFLDAGIGFGGSCLPKDLMALLEIGKEHGFDFQLLSATQAINQQQPERLIRKFSETFPALKGLTVAVWGLSFKPGTDDLRDAPSLKILQDLLKLGVKVKVFDPVARLNAEKILGPSVEYSSDYYTVLSDTDALFILTEWDEFRSPDYSKMKQLMKQHYIFDGRNVLEMEEAAGNGFRYFGVGRAGTTTPYPRSAN
jgi:UDPglucose 6-dehydrogenase